MTTQFQDNEIILGDCVEVLRQIEPSSIDAVITDPPYGLSNHKYKDIFNVLKEWISGNDSLVPDKKGFMGKEWDAFVPPPAVWKEVESLFPATQPSRKTIKPDNRINKGNSMFIDRIHTPENSYNDSGSASRFFYHAEFTEEDYQPIFYCAKASKKEREMGCERLNGSLGLNFGGKLSGAGKPVNIGIRHNIHPTVKPIKLIEYLIKLTTKENQLVLDPFIGSGTTAIACRNLNRRCLGIEKNKGYYIIAKQRLTAEKEGDIFIEGK